MRELLRGGLNAEGFEVADGETNSGDFSVVANGPPKAKKPGEAL